ncbi:helix-turn-helix domain-containing protein [Mesorhizobium sophorae]|uniref:helix-turn-helix domain-containing protein n=1 Tax=Mesorhizobium sophorae TaxID=1300294 RepID=UPI003CC9AAAA
MARWGRIDLRRVIEERFGFAYGERAIGELPKAIGLSAISTMPHHPRKDRLAH